MQKAIIGKKVGMTQIFDETGKVIPVTVVEAGPCVVTQKKTVETDGYASVQLGFEDVKEHKLTKPEAGHFKKAGVEAKRHLKEFRLEKAAEMNVGDVIKADVFASGDMIDVTGISKGHGYQGVVGVGKQGRDRASVGNAARAELGEDDRLARRARAIHEVRDTPRIILSVHLPPAQTFPHPDLFHESAKMSLHFLKPLCIPKPKSHFPSARRGPSLHRAAWIF